MATVRIPLRSDFSAFSLRVELDAVIYTLAFRYNVRYAHWIMDIKTEQEAPILCGIPLITNVSLISQYTKSDLPPGQFLVLKRDETDTPPTRNELGGEAVLLYEEALA